MARNHWKDVAALSRSTKLRVTVFSVLASLLLLLAANLLFGAARELGVGGFFEAIRFTWPIVALAIWTATTVQVIERNRPKLLIGH